MARYFSVVHDSLLRLVLAAIVSVVVCAVAVTNSAFAVEESLTLSPSSKEYTFDAGSTFSDSFRVVNTGETAYDFIVYAAPYFVSNHTYDPDYTTIKQNTGAFQWVSFDQTSWSLEPGEEAVVTYTIRVPKDAAPGGHYSVLFAETQPKEADSTQILRTKRPGSVMRITVNGDYITGGSQLSSSTDWLQFQPPLVSDLQIENTGNVDFKAETTFRVSDLFGNVKFDEQSSKTIYPGTIRDIELVWSQAPWFGLFHVEQSSKFLDQSEESSSYVLIAPKWLFIVLVLVMIGGIYGMVVSWKTRR